MDTYNGQGSRKSRDLNKVTQQLYQVLVDRTLPLELCHVPSKKNQADGPWRRISAVDSMLSTKAWERVEVAFGGSCIDRDIHLTYWL